MVCFAVSCWFLLGVAVLSCSVANAAYKPGWLPPACLAETMKPTNISVEFDPYPAPVFQNVRAQSAPTQKFFVFNKTSGRMEKFFVRGVGYSPIPPSRRTYASSFDLFTSEFSHIWKRDLDKIVAMGANTVRVWSWDSHNDHTEFLNALYAKGLYIMVPFMFDYEDYHDLGEPGVRSQCLGDWKAFVMSVMNHPAVLAFLVGNELNTYYGAQRNELISLVNQMIIVRDEVDFARHPVSMPLSDVAFVASYFNEYFLWSMMEFWSLQSYRPNWAIQKPIYDYYYSYVVNQSASGVMIKPLILTEFGVDALAAPNATAHISQETGPAGAPMNDTLKQANTFCEMFSATRDNLMIPGLTRQMNGDFPMSPSGVVGGIIAMEWNDEWWKGTFADVRSPGCPNRRTEEHSWCAQNVATQSEPYYLHEEWLGLTSQIYDPGLQRLCLCDREAYHALAIAYQCNGDENCTGKAGALHSFGGDGFGCKGFQQPFVSRCDWCAERENMFYNPIIAMVTPITLIFVVLLLAAVYLRRQSQQQEGALAASKHLVPPTADESYQAEESATGHNGRRLRTKIAEMFLTFCNVGTTDTLDIDSAFCPYFGAAQDRLFSLIWDKYLGFDNMSDALLVTATRIVYEQLMEAHHLWMDQAPTALGFDDMIRDMALWSIVTAWAGTINHCPEKICELFEYSKSYFEHCVAPMHGALRTEQVKDFHHGLVEVFRTYYLKVDQADFTYEDINTDAILFREKRANSSIHAQLAAFWADERQKSPTDDGTAAKGSRVRDPSSSTRNAGSECPEWDLLPSPMLEGAAKLHPYLEYHKQRNPEETLLSVCAKRYFDLRTIATGQKWMSRREAFPQRGGPFTMAFNFGWVVRYLLWQGVLCAYVQPVSLAPPMCLCEAVRILAVIDACWQLLAALLHFRIVGRLTKRIMFELLFYGAAAGVVVASNILAFTGMGVFQWRTTTSQPTMHNLFGLGMSVNSFYIIAAMIVVAIDEGRLLFQPNAPTYPIRARFKDNGAMIRIRVVFYLVLLLFAGGMLMAWVPMFSGNSLIDVATNGIAVPLWPTFPRDVWIFVFALGSCFIPYGFARLSARVGGDPNVKSRRRRQAKEEANYLALGLLYWGLFLVMNFFLSSKVLIPSVNNISFAICRCDRGNPNLSEGEHRICETEFVVTCYVAVTFVWLSTALVSFVSLYGIFEILLLVFGFIRGQYTRVGNVKNWSDVEQNYDSIRRRCMKRISEAVSSDERKQGQLWNLFMQALYDDCLLNDREKNELSVGPGKPLPNFRVKPRSAEAIRRITYHMWSLESAMAHGEVSTHSRFRSFHRVRTMPTWSCVVPAYNEPVVFDEEQLTKNRSEKKVSLRITEIEYLAHTFSDEWDNLAERLKKQDSSWIVAQDNYAADLLSAFLNTPGHPKLAEGLRFEVRWWATMRGQTLARTIAGLVNWRTAMLHLLQLEEDGITEDEAQRIMFRKCQIVISHQTYNVNNDVNKTVNCPSEEALDICFRKLKWFEVVYNDDKFFQSVRRRVNFDVLVSPEGRQGISYVETKKIEEVKDGKKLSCERKFFNFYPREAFDVATTQRVGRLKIGEGKAENQMHALQFVNGMVLQAMDMNQYTTLENGFKLPYIVGDYFNTPSTLRADDDNTWDKESVIPPFRILGFPEYAYTRPLSLVGELMGAAEWCFVTITQRVLDWPLRIRLHYGHPDMFDAFWVRNRGGQSKASPLVNTNEDIFAGYEMLGRGDRGSFIDFLEAQKGRETSFPGAFTFEGKLAQGGAQQVRSFDVYRLNRGLDIFSRLSLFFTSLAFYITNLLMAVSVNYYIMAIALFAISGVSYHKLGLLDAVIAVPWLIQIGYVLALPLVVEFAMQAGFWRSIGQFLRMLPPSIMFFVFHLRTKTYYFTQGLLVGKGGYAGTGRGFGLERNTFVEMYKNYSESHYSEALLVGAVLLIYAFYGTDPIGAYLLRTFNILLIVISWLWAPILFNPAPTTQDLGNDTKDVLEWASNERKETKTLEQVQNTLKRVHLYRVLGLVTNLAKECKTALGPDHQGASLSGPIQPAANGAPPATAGGGPPGYGAVNDRNENGGDNDELERDADSLRSFAVTKALREGEKDTAEGDMMQALATVYSILSESKNKLQRQIARIPGDEKLNPNTTYDDVIKEYWGPQENESWIGWWLKWVVMSQWESEDQFFPGLINLVVQKIYLTTEVYFPWIVLSLTEYYIDSIWFLYLASMFVAVSYMIEKAFSNHHEYTTLAKGTLLLTLPTTLLFFNYSLMTAKQLAWSMIMYLLVISVAIRGAFGIINAYSKFKSVGFSGNPYRVAFEARTSQTGQAQDRLQVSVWNRIEEMEVTNQTEETRFQLFIRRMRHIKYVTAFRSIIPYIAMTVIVIGNALTVVLSDWVTTLNFNGRVNEAWKKAYLRPPLSNKEDDGKPPPAARAVPLTHSAQVAQEEAYTAAAAVYGSLSSSLQPNAARRTLRAPSKNTLSSGRVLAFPPASSGNAASGRSATALSIHSFGSQQERDDELTDQLLSGSHSQSASVGAAGGQPRHQMHFLHSIADKYKK